MHVLNFITALGGRRCGLLPTCKRRIADMQPTYYRHAIDVQPTRNRRTTDTTTVGRLMFESCPIGLKVGCPTANR